jgi:hypothetical protein
VHRKAKSVLNQNYVSQNPEGVKSFPGDRMEMGRINTDHQIQDSYSNIRDMMHHLKQDKPANPKVVLQAKTKDATKLSDKHHQTHSNQRAVHPVVP